MTKPPLTAFDCDLCRKPFKAYADNLNSAKVMWLAPGLIYYPRRHFGSYNGAEVCLNCCVSYQEHCISEGLMSTGD